MMYQSGKNEGLERNFRGVRTVFEWCYKPRMILGVFWDYFGLFGELYGSLFLCPKWSILGSGGTGGGTNWRDIFRKVEGQKWVKRHTDS